MSTTRNIRDLLSPHQKTLKPWGWESCIYSTQDIAIWHLFINKGEQTSLHAHPKKKTALIVLDGYAAISFLNGDERVYQAGEKINIHRGVFHRTKASYDSIGYGAPVQLLEIETPNNKDDLVRINDKYGRKQGYEQTWEVNPDIIDLRKTPVIGGCKLALVKLGAKDYLQYLELIEHNCSIVCIRGGLHTTDNIAVWGPGDAIVKKDFLKLANEFVLSPVTEVLICTRK